MWEIPIKNLDFSISLIQSGFPGGSDANEPACNAGDLPKLFPNKSWETFGDLGNFISL